MNPLVAKTLIPKFTEPKWTSAFDFSIASDEDISMNKRGSGVRRLILLNFFRAEVERKKKEKNAGTVIYAFEEPETSQHPNHQKKLIEAFIELGKESDVQVILTTHSPEIAKILPEDSLRLIQKNGKSISIHDTNTDDEILEKIATTLGVLPSIEIEDINKVKVVVCLEGYKDIDFLEGVNSAIQQFKDLVDIKNDSRVICIPLGGSTLEFWVNRRYLSKLNLTEIHIYDSDLSSKDPKNIKKYENHIKKVNRKGGNNFGCLTIKSETENYIHPELIQSHFKITTCYKSENWLSTWDILDLPDFVREETHKDENIKSYGVDSAKKDICGVLSKQMTENYLKELNAFDEIKNWFEKIKLAID